MQKLKQNYSRWIKVESIYCLTSGNIRELINIFVEREYMATECVKHPFYVVSEVK